MAYTHGSSPNLLVRPIDAHVGTPDGERFNAQNDATPEVVLEECGKARVVLVTCRLLSTKGRDSGIRLRTRYEYRWGYGDEGFPNPRPTTSTHEWFGFTPRQKGTAE